MRALYLEDSVRWKALEPTELKPDQVRVRVRLSPITGYDRDAAEGRVSFQGVLGSNFVGVVEAGSGLVAERLVGRRVVGRGLFGCGHCDACRSGATERCSDRLRPGLWGAPGAHAETITLPAAAVAVVPEGISDEAAALAPLLALIYSGLLRIDLPSWANLLVLGDGGMGLLAAVAYASAGYTVTVRGRFGDRFDLLRRHGIHFNLVSEEEEISGLRPGRFGPALTDYPIVVDASGAPSGWLAATRLVSVGGVILLLSSCNDGAGRALADIQSKNVRLLGLRDGPLEPMFTILERGLLDPADVITATFDFEDAIEAYRQAATPQHWIVMLRFPSAEH